jgi:hypothetical protein
MNIITKLFLMSLISVSAVRASAQVTLAKWTFPNNLISDTIQNGTLTLNLGAAIRTYGTSTLTMTNGQTTGDYAVTATGWDNGADLKNWNIHIATTGYSGITLSSKQRSGNTNAGPVNWKAQYKAGHSGNWNDIPGGSITVANDWSGVLNNLSLPSDCDNISDLYIRWIMTTNIGIGAANVGSAGVSKIDDIVITGSVITGFEDQTLNTGLKLYPNPARKILNIESYEIIKRIFIYNYAGSCVYDREVNSGEMTMDVSSFDHGLYILKCVYNFNRFKTQRFEID